MEEHEAKLGIPWFKPEQWTQLREISADPDVLEVDYDTWHQKAEGRVRDFESRGIHVEQVLIDVNEFSEWCRSRQMRCDAQARSQYAAEEVRKRHETT